VTLSVPRTKYNSVARTHVGHVRALNEDRYVDRPDIGLWAIADGMGGPGGGDIAADTLAQFLTEVPRAGSGKQLLLDVRTAIMGANRMLIERALKSQNGAMFGSTIVALLTYQDFYICLWAGDSRAYLLRNNKLKRITTDHSVVQEMIDSGKLSPEQARNHVRSNVITRAVGVTDDLDLDMEHGRLQAGDIFLLCSDGLTGMVEDTEIQTLLRASTPDVAGDWLLDTVLDRGARDNVTFVLIDVLALK
jgi:serine/threonine protein phosphatase PrpC